MAVTEKVHLLSGLITTFRDKLLLLIETLTTIPNTKLTHFYIFEEFDIWQHLDPKASFKMNCFNMMMELECKDKDDLIKVTQNHTYGWS